MGLCFTTVSPGRLANLLMLPSPTPHISKRQCGQRLGQRQGKGRGRPSWGLGTRRGPASQLEPCCRPGLTLTHRVPTLGLCGENVVHKAHGTLRAAQRRALRPTGPAWSHVRDWPPDGIQILSHICPLWSPGGRLSGVIKGSQSTGPTRPPGLDPWCKGHGPSPGALRPWLCSPPHPAFFPDLAPGIDEIYEESQQVFLAPGHPQDGQVVFYKISVDRGLKWEEAFAKSLELTGPYDGFYLSYKVRGNKPSCLLAEQNHGKQFTVYKPNIGRQSQLETLDSLCRKFRRVTAEEAREHWESGYAFSLTHCSHTAWNQHCRLVQEGKDCTQGLRLRHHYMLCGALLRVWGRIAAVMADVSSSSYLQIVRLKTKDKKKQVGIKIPEGCVRRVLQELRQMDADVKRRSACGPGLATPTQNMPRALELPYGPGEVLDLTYSPPVEAFPPPLHFTFPAPPPDPGALLLGTRDSVTDPAALAHQGCDINFKEVLEDMLRSLNAGPAEPSGPLGAGAAGPERQSVIHFSPPFPNS
uniref:protein strawberry notch homolog 2 n=1 Tax=Callospermophilus lateralis TaxID=76772 RepID=UPI004038D6BA